MIESYSFGKIVIDGQRYTNDVIIFPNRVKDDWWRKEGHSLHPEDLEEVMEEEPEVLVVGKGHSGLVTIPEETKKFIESRGIDLIAKPTEEACEEFNELSKTKKVVAALHLTC
ncbi:hypothetical protein AKJ42_01810 [candidate division MSBL1 archaeon SCGC-AAA261C02]|uniref:Mth938-like domain-containing protein n=1 Tax=candidate division MSBL1 archaeon SCGC-AAA261C02 TaxID=1698272 RepID=A0A133V0V1_9EURY|nr:hypothetical protein AKJ42_01810 [candidate division MSBL1 archaeon SCGC-AAA261C02]